MRNYVTHEMAMDAGDPSLEGEPLPSFEDSREAELAKLSFEAGELQQASAWPFEVCVNRAAAYRQEFGYTPALVDMIHAILKEGRG